MPISEVNRHADKSQEKFTTGLGGALEFEDRSEAGDAFLLGLAGRQGQDSISESLALIVREHPKREDEAELLGCGNVHAFPPSKNLTDSLVKG